MEFADRVHGWTLVEAMSELQVEVFRLIFAASGKAGSNREHDRRVAWEGIAQQLQTGDLEATGILPRKTSPELVHAVFAAAAQPDFEKNTLTLNETVYAAVRIWRSERKTEPSRYRTGAAGRPSSAQLVKAELRRRKAEGQMLGSLSAECIAISEWLAREHSEAPQIKPKSMASVLRPDYRTLCQKS